MKTKIGIISFTVFFLIVFTAYSFIQEKKIRENRCMENIRKLEKAKLWFGAKYGAGMGSEITLKVLDSYSGGGLYELSCPSGGEYHINPVGRPVTCSHHIQ